jgi:putative oxidoreductase
MPTPIQSDSSGKLVLRLTLGILILFHGISKLMHPAGAIGYISAQLSNAGFPSYLAYGVFIGEVLAPIMIILGFYSRIGALIVVINMIFAVVLVHTAQIFSLAKTGGWTLELQAFYLFTALALFLFGSGKVAIKPD